jgi:hypothetical protein
MAGRYCDIRCTLHRCTLERCSSPLLSLSLTSMANEGQKDEIEISGRRFLRDHFTLSSRFVESCSSGKRARPTGIFNDRLLKDDVSSEAGAKLPFEMVQWWGVAKLALALMGMSNISYYFET